MMKILYVEDTPLHVRIMRKISEMAGCELIDAKTGADAVMLLDLCPNLIILDVGLPDIDGFTLATKIHALTPQTPIVAISAGTMAEDRQQALDAGCIDYLSKPFGFLWMVEYLKHFRE